jgi:hypothetical protein
MAGNIPGTGGLITPGVFTNVQTLSTGVSVPGGIRIAAILGEGLKPEIVVTAALGNGKDGLDPTYTTTTGQDGRHFALSTAPIISNRTQVFRDGILLQGLEGSITPTTTFSNVYDYMVDPSNGHILLQAAHLVDQGGTFWTPGASNVGVGVINNLSLIDVDAPNETWIIKCISVQRDNMNNPIAGTASFVAFGTVSGNKLDANGNTILWTADNVVINNGVLSFSIQETNGVPFRQGDSFTIEVSSGVLTHNDTLTANYIPVGNINAPIFLQSMNDVAKNFGLASTSNALSLGCQLAFANNTPGIMCVQTMPGLPRRTSYQLTDNMVATLEAGCANIDDFIFPLPLGVVPDPNSQIHFFIQNNTTSVETQVLPNQFPYYELGLAGQPTLCAFVGDNTQAPAGNSFSYSVIQEFATDATGFDGYITPGLSRLQGVFGSSIVFDSSYIGKILLIIDAQNTSNISENATHSSTHPYFTINSVVNGQLQFSTNGFTSFTSGSGITFELINPLTGAPITGSSGTDGTLTDDGLQDGIGSFTSSVINFGTVGGAGLLGLQLKIAGQPVGTNNGAYAITAYNSGTNTLTIERVFITETDVRYEIIDPLNVSEYIVVNKNIVPNGFGLRVTIVDARDASFYDAGWINALAALEKVDVDIIVPLPLQTISVIFQNTVTHCITMSNIANKLERVTFIGAINGLTPSNLIGTSLAAVESLGVLEGIHGNTVAEILDGDTEDLANYSVSNSYGETFRAVYFFPDQIVVQAGTSNVIVSGYFLAAAAAGYCSGNNNIAMPLTNKVLSGFTILSNKMYSPLTLAQLAQAGVTVLQPVTGGGRVVWGITTTQSGFVEEEEISIVFIRDRIAKSMRSGMAAFIGLPQTDTIVADLSARANGLLNSFISQGWLTQWKDLLIEQDSVDPTQIDISVRVAPVFPIDFIYVTISIGLL